MQIVKLKHKYDNFTLDISNVLLEKNRIIGLVGQNGAGKTTLMALLSGFLRANRLFEISDYHIDQILFIPSSLQLYEYLTVGEFANLLVKHATKEINVQTLLSELQLIAQQDVLIGDLSQGMQKKLTLGNLFTKQYHFLILDEPFNSIDLQYTYNLKQKLHELSKHVTVLISSHILDTLSNLCDEFIYIENGVVTKQFINDKQNVLERELFESSTQN